MEKVHSFNLRVYYSEVDSLGIVYHSNYLTYADRARCDWLRELGFPLNHLDKEYGSLIAVRDLQVSYKKPARFEQELTVFSRIVELKKASIVYEQDICARGDSNSKLCSIMVTVVCVGHDLRPKAIPELIYESLKGVCCGNKS